MKHHCEKSCSFVVKCHIFIYEDAYYFCVGCYWRELTWVRHRFLIKFLTCHILTRHFLSTVEDLLQKKWTQVYKVFINIKILHLLNNARFKKNFGDFVLFLTSIILQKRESHFMIESLRSHMMRKKLRNIFVFILNSTIV